MDSTVTDESGQAVGTGALDYKWEIDTQDGKKVTLNGESVEYDFPKYGQIYPIKLIVTLKGTEITGNATSSVTISEPVLSISTNELVVDQGKPSTWTSSIKYGTLEISDIFVPSYTWSTTDTATATNNTAETFTHNFQKLGDNIVTLNVTSTKFDKTLTATGNVNAIKPIVLDRIAVKCENPDQWDTVRFVCTGTLYDQHNNVIDDNTYTIQWKVVDDGVSINTTSQLSQQVTLILDWPKDRTAHLTPSRDFTATVNVIKDSQVVKSVTQLLTVQRKIKYTAKIQDYNDNGFNRKAKINFTDVQGPEKDAVTANGTVRYNWQYSLKNTNGAKQSGTFSTEKNPNSYDFSGHQKSIYYIGSVKDDPFAGGNGIGLQVEGLSKPLTIYGVNNTYAVFGPDFVIDTDGALVFLQRPNYLNMVGVTGISKWYPYAFAHNFRMNEQFKAGTYPHVLKIEIHEEAQVKKFFTNSDNGVIVSSFTVGENDGITTSSQHLGLQSSYHPRYSTFNFYVDVFGYHTSSDYNKNPTQANRYIKMGEAMYTRRPINPMNSDWYFP